MTPHNDSILAGEYDDIKESHRRSALEEDSTAAFGYYRPEIRAAPDPLTYVEAMRKYR